MKSIIKNFSHWPLVILLFIFVSLATIFSLTVPLDAAPDEKEHFDLIRYIAEEKSPPLTIQEREAVGYKGDASPLYHGLVAIFSQHVDIESLPRRHSLGIPELFIPFDTILNNRNFHTENEIFPFRGIVLAWHLARLATIPMAAATMVAIYLTALAIYPGQRYFALAVAAFAAFLPRFTINSAVLNDDNLVIPFTAFAIYFLVRVLQGDKKRGSLIALGLFIGLAAITKYHALVLLPEMTLAFLVMAWLEQRTWKLWLHRWLWVIVGFIISAGVWFVFLIVRFNRVAELGLIRGIMEPLGDPVVTDSSGFSFLSQPLAWDWIGPLYRSFWIALEGTRVFAPEPVYWIFGLITAVAIFGLVQWAYANYSSGQNIKAWNLGIALLALHFLIYMGIVFVRYQTRAAMGLGYSAAPHNIQGRHLYPALISMAFFFVLGLSEALRSWAWLIPNPDEPEPKKASLQNFLLNVQEFHWLGPKLQKARLSTDKFLAIAVSGTLIGLGFISFFYYIRPTYLPYLPILTLKPEEISVTNLVKGKVADGIKLIGYDLEITSPDADLLPLTLYWQSRANQEYDYLTQVCLYDNSEALVSCYQGHPANGLFPTRSWTANHLIRDEVTLPIPNCIPSGTYELELSMLLLRDDVAATVINSAQMPVGPISLGQLHLNREPFAAPSNVSLCTPDGCQNQGPVTLPQIRQGLTVINYTSGSQSAEDMTTRVRFVPNGDYSDKVDWLPLENAITYQCPDGRQATTHTFITDRSVIPGRYHLEIGDQTSDEIQVSVDTRLRNFDAPATMQTELGISYADKIALLGYDLDLSARYPSDPIEARLYWRARRTTDRNYVATLHLLDNEMTMWGQTDHEAGGLYPNILWAPGEVVQDVHILQNSQLSPGLYTIELGLYDGTKGFNYLPKVSTSTGQFMEHNPLLGQVRIMDPARTNSPTKPMVIELNGEIQLLGYDTLETTLDKRQPLSLALHWQAIKAPTADYTVFTQLIGPDGLVWAQQDNPPQSGRYPTTAWAVEDRVVDRFELSLSADAPAGEYRLLVGMYNWVNGERLPAVDKAGNRLPDDAIVLTTITVTGVPDTLP